MGKSEILRLYALAEEMLGEETLLLTRRDLYGRKEIICFYHLQRAYDLLKGVMLLCKEAQLASSKIVLRSFFNLYVNLKWMESGPDEDRFIRYADHESIIKFRLFEVMGEVQQLTEDNIKIKDELKVKAFGVSSKYYPSNKDIKEIRNWAPISLFQMAKEIGMSDIYKVMYAYLSEVEHTGAASVSEYVLGIQGNVPSFSPGNVDIDLVMYTACKLYIDTIEIFCKVVNASYKNHFYNSEELKKILDDIQGNK